MVLSLFLPTGYRRPRGRHRAGTAGKTYEKWELRIHKRLMVIEGSEQALRQIMRIPVPDTVQIEISLVG